MHTTTLTRVSALALALLGAGLALTSVAAPAEAEDLGPSIACTSIGGTYQAQVSHSHQTLSWSCTYTIRGQIPVEADLPPRSLEAACSGTKTFVSEPPIHVFGCVPTAGSSSFGPTG